MTGLHVLACCSHMMWSGPLYSHSDCLMTRRAHEHISANFLPGFHKDLALVCFMMIS